MDVRRLAAKAAQIENDLMERSPEGVAIVSIENVNLTEHKAGVVIEVPPAVAARHLARGTHKYADDKEIAAYRKDIETRNRKHEEQRFQKQLNQGGVAILQEGKLIRPETPPNMVSVPKPETPTRIGSAAVKEKDSN